MRRHRRLAVAIAIVLGVGGSGAAGAHHPAGDVRTVYDGAVTGPAEMVPGPKYLALDTPEELDAFYRLHLTDQPLPAVDHEATLVLAAVSGYGPATDPTIINYERTVGTPLDLLVVTMEKRGCQTCTTLANDVHVVVVERFPGVVVFGSTDSGFPSGVDVVPF